ncbi:hypothetical protein Tco_0801140 [Tanacetum coccineum]|uniref:Uncharacterized protein n=1 Tax=Tanacetum coccineum TaxID=301880 RepID=A0ABQ4YYT5_9ASTR
MISSQTLTNLVEAVKKSTNNTIELFKLQNKTEDTTPSITRIISQAVWNQRTTPVAGLGNVGIRLDTRIKRIDKQAIEVTLQLPCKDFRKFVSPEESCSTGQPLEQVQKHDESNVYDNVRRHSEQPESINDTYVLKKDDSNVTPDSSNICTNDNQQLKKANAALTQELESAKPNLDESNSALGDAISMSGSFLIALQEQTKRVESTKL